ncbi:hypothetical protein [Frigidibacter sp. MR17.24]|uniref:hypothetical protein n=1 Tax=Frigidibacter sp. MR17.24 TaxID=3127345 RepID=UPI003012DB66
MGKRIILHVGAPKCGSTYLQRVLLNNAEALAALHCAYPHDGSPHPGNAAELGRFTPDWMHEAFRPGVDTLLLSHEDLLYDPRGRQAFAEASARAGVRVSVVAFCRPFNEIVFGDYSQHMKQFFDRYLAQRSAYDGASFESFADRRIALQSPSASLEAWQRAFPGGVTLRPSREIRPLYEQLVGTGLNWQVSAHQSNRSLRTEDCERIAAAIADLSLPEAAVRELYRAAFHRAGEGDGGRTPERIRHIEDRLRDENERLLQRFGVDNRAAILQP